MLERRCGRERWRGSGRDGGREREERVEEGWRDGKMNGLGGEGKGREGWWAVGGGAASGKHGVS